MRKYSYSYIVLPGDGAGYGPDAGQNLTWAKNQQPIQRVKCLLVSGSVSSS